MNIALCAIAKNENQYLREWVEYYKNIGVSKIFLYDNNDLDGEHFEDVINDYIQSEFVKVFDVRGIEKSFHKKEEIMLQRKVYIECFETYKYEYDWFMFFDLDEYLFIKKGNLKTFLSDKNFKNVTTILLNWLNYGDSGFAENDGRKLNERFTKPAKETKHWRTNKQCKSIVRGKNSYRIQFMNSHKFILSNGLISNPSGTILNREKEIKNATNIDEKDYSVAYIKHFITKTISEYLERYVNRGKTNVNGYESESKIQRYSIDEVAKIFFEYNEKTTQKLKIVSEYKTKCNKLPQKNITDMNDKKLIVSFTTYKARLPYVVRMVHSLLNNTLKPYKIVMTLYKDDVKFIPSDLQDLIDKNIVELIICDMDLRPHKKYFYVMQKYKEYPILTVDDDVVYDKNVISSLFESYIEHPASIHGTRGRFINTSSSGYCKDYNTFKICKSKTQPCNNVLLTGVGGILYPPNAFHLSDDNIKDILKYVTVDDIYLYYLTILNGYNIVCLGKTCFGKEIVECRGNALYTNDNARRNNVSKNDIAIRELINVRLHDKRKFVIQQTSGSLKKKLTISLTSFRPRISNLTVVLPSLVNQTHKAYRIVVNLSPCEFPNKEMDLPKGVVDYIASQGNLIELNWVDGPDTHMWRKFIPTLLKYKDDLVLGVDDDYIYPSDMVEEFCKTHIEHPDAPISGNRLKMYGLNCHCGSASLIQYKHFQGYIENIPQEILDTVASQDLFYTYIASRNNYTYVQTQQQFFTNLQQYNSVEPFKKEFDCTTEESWNRLTGYYERPKKREPIIKITNDTQHVTFEPMNERKKNEYADRVKTVLNQIHGPKNTKPTFKGIVKKSAKMYSKSKFI